jgi:acetyl-CoA carboxylase biotin carboxyl carrier protein
MGLSDEDVREILRLVDESKLDELRIETPEFRLHVRRGGAPAAEEEEPAARAGASDRSASEPAPAPEPAPAETTASNGAVTIEAPMLGTFYRASSPGAEPFVEVGTEVETGTVVCLIEVMKMMNSIQAGVAGKIVEVCAENAQLVESGEPLFRVDPPG